MKESRSVTFKDERLSQNEMDRYPAARDILL